MSNLRPTESTCGPVDDAAHGRLAPGECAQEARAGRRSKLSYGCKKLGAVCAAAGGAAHRQGSAWVLTPDSMVVQWWDMTIRWLAIFYFLTARRPKGTAFSHSAGVCQPHARHNRRPEVLLSGPCWLAVHTDMCRIMNGSSLSSHICLLTPH